MKKKTIIQMMVGILFLLTLIISSTYAYFNIVSTTNRNTTSNYNAKLEDIEKYGTSLLTGGEGELHLRVKASDMTPSKISNKYYATTSEEDYQLRRGNHIVSKATIQKGLSNYEYNCTSKLTITLDGTMVSEEGLQVGDAKLYLRGTNNNIKNEEYDLKTLIDELELNSEGKKEYTREIEYLLTSDNEGKVMIDVEFANNSNNQTTSSGKNLNIEITNSELVCGLGNNKVYANLSAGGSSNYAYRTTNWKDKIITASFVNYKPNEEELLTKPMYWDLTDTSKSETGSVVGWLEEREETDTYDLYIGADKEIYTTLLMYAFYSMSNLQEIKFDNLNTSEATNMAYMFSNTNLIDLNVSNFDTSKVTTMSNMFTGFKGTTLDISNFDTSNVTTMSRMFYSSKITDLNLSNFDTSIVNDMSYMFYNCSNLTDLDLSSFNTSKVINMNEMFRMNDRENSNLKNINFDGWNTTNVTNMSGMFTLCTNLTKLDLTDFDISKVTKISGMFNGISAEIIFPNNFGHDGITMSGLFSGYKGTSLDISTFDTSSITDMSSMFSGVLNITSIEQIKGFKELDTSKVIDMHSMFYNSKIVDLDLSNFDTSKVTNMSYMFYNSEIETINLKNFNTSQVTDMSWMFYLCKKLNNLDIKNFDTSNVENMSYMFSNCSKLDNLDVSNFDISKVTNMHNMFYGLGVKSLEDIKGLYEFDTSKVTDAGGIFAGCNNIVEIDLTKFELDSVTNMSAMFEGLSKITSINQIKGFKELDTSKVTNMRSMFYNSRITDLDLSHFVTTSVTDMSWMFYNSQITDLDISNFNTSSVTDMSYMFHGCYGLKNLDLSHFVTSSVTNISSMFEGCRNLKDLKLNKATFGIVKSYSSMFKSVPSDIHLTIKKGQEDFINKRLNDAYPDGHTAKIDLVD